MGDYQQAKHYYDKALLLDEGNISIMLDIGDVENKLGNFQQALNQYQSALMQCKIPQDKSTVYNRLENYYRSLGQVTKALEYLLLKQEENEKFQPPFGMLLLKLLDIPHFVQAGKKETALQQVKVIEKQLKPPFDQIMVFGYAALYVELRDIARAEQMTAEIDNVIKTFGVTLSGAYSFKYHFQGEIHELKKEYKKAIQSYSEYVKINPVSAKINVNIGRCYRHIKEYQKAEKYIRKCLKIYPFSPDAHYELAIVYSELGKQQEALSHLKTTLDIWENADPIYEPAKRAREKYQQLKAQPN
jgi:tetratricopeptide (TPR) repeat protein